MSTLVTIHQKLGVALLLVFVVATVLAVVATRRGDQLPAIRVYVRLCQVAVGVQVLAGLVILAGGHRPASALHYFYGAATLLAPPLAVGFSRREGDRREALILALGTFAALLFTIRAIGTGG